MKYPKTKCPILSPKDWKDFKREHREDVLRAAGTLEAADAAMRGDGLILEGWIHVHLAEGVTV